MGAPQPPSVGLGGDGDEVDAIECVEKTFGVKFDNSDAETWRTAGDVYRSLCQLLPAGACDRPETWEQFVAALTDETGVDPKTIRPESSLIGPPASWPQIAGAVIVALIAAAVLTAIGRSLI